MAKLSPSNPLAYIINREYVRKNNFTKTLIRERLNCARSLFRKDLLAHYGCVNAIEFSHRGDLLVSGGDDRRVLIWNVEQAVQGIAKTVAMRWQHNSNIFCLGFDSTNSKVFSAGNDDQVIVHDASTGDAVNFFLHEQPVYGLSIDPLNDNVFASACDDGRVLLYDIREHANSEPFCLASYTSSFNAVMFNPLEPRMLTTANSKEGVGLWDVRKPCQILLQYGNLDVSQSCMSVRFNHNGTHILALRRRLPPVLYAIHSPEHICQFDHPGYYNSCTMKSCCFAGDDDEYVLSGSDDFGLYVWKIPTSDEKDQWVDRAHMILRGHRSIVNQVRYNPSSCIIASSGVEKLIKFWSPFALPEASGSLMKDTEPSDNLRKVFTHEEYISLVLQSGEFMTHDYSHKSTKEDPRMMAFFDSLVQREIEGWTTDESASTEMSVHEVAGSASESDSPLSDTPVTALTAALVEALEGQGSATEPSTIEPGDDVGETNSTDAQNRISQLIARKRAQLMRLARSQNSEDVEIMRPSRTRKLCLVERSSDSSDSGREVSVAAEDSSSHKNSETIDTNGCESEYRSGKAGSSSKSKYFDFKDNVDTRKRRIKYLRHYSDSSDDDNWYLHQKRKRKAPSWPSDSSDSDMCVYDDDKESVSNNKIVLKHKNKVCVMKGRENDSDTSSSDDDSGQNENQASTKVKRKSSKCEKFSHLNRRSNFKPRSKAFHKKISENIVDEFLSDETSDRNGEHSNSCVNGNDATVPTKIINKEALIECIEDFNKEPNLPVTPNSRISSGASFQDSETPDSGIASTSSPFSRPSSNSSHRSISPRNKSPEQAGESSCSLICQPCCNEENIVENPHSSVLGSNVHVRVSDSIGNPNSNLSEFVSSENRSNSDWTVFQRFRNRVNRMQRNFRKRISDDSDSN
ncbi:Retinoblastoma-binding protein 5 homolog [Gryllus bimaculatus]|nr:Retinoblastoma-binding protein 5 homolog [Gryllus bimaculatus]